MSNLEQAARQALEALERGETKLRFDAITSLRVALEQQQASSIEDQLEDAIRSLEWHKRRIDLLQQWQSKMRDPERTIVCDIIANGQTLEPAGDRYTLQPAASAVPDGWNLVPVEPTPEMLGKGQREWLDSDGADPSYDVYSAMLAAAPEPEAPAAVAQEPSPTAGMNIAQRILHVGGRNNAAGYVEFGSIQAVEALVRQVLRDLPQPAAPQPRQPLTTEQYTKLAHRIASRYSHRSEPQFIAYTFLPQTLEQFVRAIEAAISNQQPMKLSEQKEPQ